MRFINFSTLNPRDHEHEHLLRVPACGCLVVAEGPRSQEGGPSGPDFKNNTVGCAMRARADNSHPK